MSLIKNIVFIGVSCYLAFVFAMAGGNKLYPIDPTMHEYLVGASQHWPKVFAPIFGNLLPSGDIMRTIIGASEVLGAVAVVLSPWILPKSLGTFASLGFIAIMAGAIYLHAAFNDSIMTPLTLLICAVVRLALTPAGKAVAKKQKQN